MNKQSFVVILTIASLGLLAGPKSGIDTSGFDQSVRPQDDFFRYVNGGWIERAEIPPDRPSYGSFHKLRDHSEEAQQTILTELKAAEGKRTPNQEKLVRLFDAFMDQAQIDRRGSEPLTPYLERIDQISDRKQLVAYLVESSKLGFGGPLAFFVAVDAENASRHQLNVAQSGLTLPNRDYYLRDDESLTKVRSELPAYVNRLFNLAGQSTKPGDRVTQLETLIAQCQWSIVDEQDSLKTRNPMKLKQIDRTARGLRANQWPDLLDLKLKRAETVNVNQPSYLSELATLLYRVPLEDWKDYFRFRILNGSAPHLSTPLADAHYQFHGGIVSGQKAQSDRWKRGIRFVNGAMGEALGAEYVARYFPPEAKQRMDTLVANLLSAFDQAIDENQWMTPTTKTQAKDKLSKFKPYIGYPDKIKPYDALEVQVDDHYGNVRRAVVFGKAENFAKLRKPVDRDEWGMTPQTVNAYYSPTRNKVVFPAAILQPPFFDMDADDAVNYGAIGAVIGHEISHGFDDQGRRYDGQGNLRDWWVEADNTAFLERAGKLVDQFDGFSPLPDLSINGELTLGENIGDLSGLTIAYRAFKKAYPDSSRKLDGFSGDQRFFIGFAQIWRSKMRDEYLRMIVLSDEHAPPEFRVNGTLANMPEFHRAFQVVPGDGLYRQASDIVKIW